MLKKIVTVMQFLAGISFFVLMYAGIAVWSIGVYQIVGMLAIIPCGLMLTMLTALLLTIIEDII